MNFQEMVFNAAKYGDLYQLKICLDGKPKKELSSLVSSRTNGSTPLIAACRNGHLDVALYLVERCHADIEQVGSVTFDDEEISTIEATPLWHATDAGHLKVVKMLVKYNASVNSTSENSTTALLIACFNGRLKIAQFLIQHGADIEIADKDGDTCLMIACCKKRYKISKHLLECGADTNRKNLNGCTALHFCAETGNLNILKILLQSGAKSFSDFYGTTPLLAAAILGHSQFVEYFIHEVICTKEEQVNALELLGSFFAEINIEKALEFWKRGTELRYKNEEFPLEHPIIRSPLAADVDAYEVRTLYQLEELVYDPDEMSIQALRIVERITGPNHPLAFNYIISNGERYCDNGNFHRCMKLWMYALDMELKAENTLKPRVMELFALLADLFFGMMEKALSLERYLPSVLFRNTLKVFEICLRIFKKDIYVHITEKDDDYTTHVQHTLIFAITLVDLMCRLRPHLNIDEHTELKQATYRLVYLNPMGKNSSTLLHLACSNDSSSCYRFCVIEFPSPEVVAILLEAGACPNEVDTDKNTPLHVAAMNKPFSPDVFKLLVHHGGHLCLFNNERKTPLQLAEDILPLDGFPMQYINLKCLCAQAIRKYEIVYEGIVHKKLKEFVDFH